MDPTPDEQPVVQPAPQTSEQLGFPAPTEEAQQPDQNQGYPQQPAQNKSVVTQPVSQPSTWQKVKAAVQEGEMNSPFNAIAPFDSDKNEGFVERAVDEWHANQQGPKIEPDQLNLTYPGMDVPFSQPETDASAKIKYDHNEYVKSIRSFISEGTPLPWLAQQAIGLGVGIANPGNYAAFALAGIAGGEVGAAGLIGEAAHALGTMGGLEYGAYKEEQNEQQNPDPWDHVKAAIYGAAFVTGIHAWADSAGEYKAKVAKDLQEADAKTALAQAELNSRIDSSPAHTAAIARANGIMDGQMSPYRFTPWEHPSNRPVFAAIDSDGKPVNTMGPEFGPGRTLTDDPVLANNHAAGGQVDQYILTHDLKMLDVEQSVNAPWAEVFLDEIRDLLPGRKLPILEGESIKDVLSRLGEMAEDGKAPSDILTQVQGIAKREGLGGFEGIQELPNGDVRHFVHLFDDSINPNQSYKSSMDSVPKVTTDQMIQAVKNAEDPTTMHVATPEIEKEYNDLHHGKPLFTDQNEIQRLAQEKLASDTLRLKELAKTMPEVQTELDKPTDDSQGKLKQSIWKSLTNCFGQSMS